MTAEGFDADEFRAEVRAFCRERGQDLVAQADALLESFERPQDQREHLRAVGRYLVDRDR